MSAAMEAAKEAVQTAENLIHRRVSECYGSGTTHPSIAPLTVRDATILTDALIKVMDAVEQLESQQ